ncbi:hypothetical protein JQ596_20630 [Bradyrhizobium manausense]|uniref:hypothetical protein n=1 Tax=Bradyrhizobium TaxID=374 RepID=UPI001BA63EA7|nr:MULTISPECIES: hypothetical protein [Bradyrhizobium]MBR0827943.1 hypothetical protein [Bradyrhizobium manausense]UVO32812.1 hypothetical protein KUF59_20430 [Bradyrhizobium arachidis]
MRLSPAILCLALASGVQAASAATPFDGLWARSQKDCRNEEGPDSKTLVDLDNVIKGKPAPIVDQYENHCRIDRKAPSGTGLVLTATCFEFWDDYKKGVAGRKVTIKLAQGPNGMLTIDGKPYLRCEMKKGSKAGR